MKGTKSQKNFIMTPDGTIVSEDPNFLKENKNAMTWDQYQKKMNGSENKGKPSTIDKVEQDVVNAAVKDLS